MKFPLTAAALAACLYGPLCAHAEDANLGRNLAATCANCHGTNGQARGDMKALAGEPAAKIVALMAAFRNGTQPATVMHQIAKGYSEQQVRLIAEFLAAQKSAN